MELPTKAELEAILVKHGVPLMIRLVRMQAPPRELGLVLLAIAFSFLRDGGLETPEDASGVCEQMWFATKGTHGQFLKLRKAVRLQMERES